MVLGNLDEGEGERESVVWKIRKEVMLVRLNLQRPL